MKSNIIKQFPILIFLAIWILPVGYYGLTNTMPFWISGALAEKTNVSRLFAWERPQWSVYKIFIRDEGSTEFRSLDESRFFHQSPFGYETRFQRLMAFASPSQKMELSSWVYAQLSREKTKIAALQFAYLDTAAPASANVAGHYAQPNSRLLPPSAFHIEAEYDFPP